LFEQQIAFKIHSNLVLKKYQPPEPSAAACPPTERSTVTTKAPSLRVRAASELAKTDIGLSLTSELVNNDVIVKTKPENDLYKLFMQRVRWAGKSTSYKSSHARFLAVVVLLMNLSLTVTFCLLPFAFLNWKVFLIVFLTKYEVDYIMLYKSNAYLRKGKFFVPIASSVIYPFFSSLVGIYSIFGSFRWKGRIFRK
jgi:hypothetical protein